MENKNDRYGIFSNRGHLSQEELKNYRDGKLTLEDLNELEAKIDQSDFEKDALEGFQAFPEALDSPIDLSKQEFFKKNGITQKTSVRNIIILAGCAVALFLVGAGLFSKLNKKEVNLAKTNAPIIKTDKKEVEPKQTTPAPVLDSIPEEIQKMELLTPEKVIHSNVIQKDNLEGLKQEIIENELDLDIQPIEITSIEAIIKKPEVRKYLEKKFVPTIYLSDLKVIDYSKKYEEPIDILSFDLSGTPANKEQDSSTILDDGSVIKHINYLDYLDEAMLLFSENKFRQALFKYKTILKFYPEDENAFFYGGLCYFNLKQPKTAITYFEKLQFSGNEIFNQEATWFLAKSYFAKGDKVTTKSLLKKIVSTDGFYKKQAQNWLKEL